MNATDTNTRQLALVTGASSGIGYELAKVFAKNGFDLVVCSDHGDIVEAAQAFQSFGGDVVAVQADLATFEGVEKLYGRIQSLGRPVHAAALNAGVGVGGRFEDTDLSKELNMIQLNVTSTVHLAKRLLPDFVRRGEGRLLFTSSIAAEAPGPYFAVYAATKAFVQSFAEALHHEVKDKGVTVTALQPGPTDTNFFARADMLDTKVAQGKKDDPADVAQQGFDALMSGKDHAIAGSLKSKMQGNMSKVMTQQQNAAMNAGQTKPGSGTKHH